jgi:hypothetical protein
VVSGEKDTLFYFNIVSHMARARVAEPGQRRKVEVLKTKIGTFQHVKSKNIFKSLRFARVAEPGQRRQLEGLVSKEFLGSNPIPRIITVSPYQGAFLPVFLGVGTCIVMGSGVFSFICRVADQGRSGVVKVGSTRSEAD